MFTVRTLKIYDPAMCCSTGVCGPIVDFSLVEFAGALKTAEKKGVEVQRYNLAQQPQAFMENEQVKNLLSEKGNDALPFIFANDDLKVSGRYPTTIELFDLLGIQEND